MADLKKLAEHRKDILLAEVAAWLHNIGKLEPNFLVMQTADSPEVIEDFRIPGQYTFKRFCKPSILLSEFPYENLKGPLYFVNLQIANEIKELQQKVREIQQQLNNLPTNAPERKDLGKELRRLDKKLKQKRGERSKSETDNWKRYEQRIEQCNVVNNWPLGSLLTLFWESEWFEKPNVSSFEPGSGADPDYQRRPKSGIQLKSGFTMDLPALLLLAHGEVSGQEKRGLDQVGRYVDVDYKEKSASSLALDSLRKATAFGYESVLDWKSWTEQRKHIIDKILAEWEDAEILACHTRTLFIPLRDALGDTQRPINEITLWDYSDSIAALFKASVSQAALLKQTPTPATMRWRLLSIRLDATDFLFHVQNVADLVARKRLLDTSYGLIEHLFAVEFPIGSPVYQDENGIVFVIPELPGYEDIKLKQEFESLVYKALKEPNVLETLTETIFLHGAEDIRPIVQITPPRRGKKLNLVEALSKPSTNAPEPRNVKIWWADRTEEKCSVCGLRPEGYVEPGLPPFVTEQKARERHLCGVCLARRGRRSEEWATQEPDSTIWVGEVADINARIALIVGRFALDDWLSGKLVRSMTIGTDEFGNWLAKPPTFARIHRIWRTTFEFWQESLAQIRDSLTDDRRRLRLYLDSPPDLGSYHVYELDLGVTSVGVVWVPPKEKQQGYLLSVENLGYIAKQLGEKDFYQDPDLAAISVEEHIQKQLPWDAVLQNPEAHAEARSKNLMKGHKIINVDYQDVSYATIIPILAEPRTFMALVPADKAVDVVQAIRTKYEREMGKVRNRLPLHLGVVFADAHTPLRAILDAGQRMLTLSFSKKQPNGKTSAEQTKGWVVSKVKRFGEPNQTNEKRGWKALSLLKRKDLTEAKKGNDHFRAIYAVALKHHTFEQCITWYVPAVMGDGSTEDNWYPYVFWEQDKDGNTDPGSATIQRKRYYQAPNPFKLDAHGKPQLGWLVHAGELEPGDKVYFTPATLDFQWLDGSASRFEIAYDGESGLRRGSLHRPYLLDELDDLQKCWQLLAGDKRLTNTQIHQVRDLIEAKRREWFPENPQDSLKDATFRQFCRDVLKNAEWGEAPSSTDIKRLTNWAVSGVLTDAVELFAQILKRKAPEGGEA